MDITDINRITGEILNCAFRIHTALGPGVLESVYEAVLARDLERRGFHVQKQKKVSFEFEGMMFKNALTADLVVDNTVVVEIKAREKLSRVHRRQLLTYLKLLDCPVGLLLNFGEDHLRDGIDRIANAPLELTPSVPSVSSV